MLKGLFLSKAAFRDWSRNLLHRLLLLRSAQQCLFLIEGLPSVIVGIWVVWFLDSGIKDAKWLNDEEKALLVANITEEDKDKHEVKLIGCVQERESMGSVRDLFHPDDWLVWDRFLAANDH
jgi:hypothetical protein